MSFLRMNLYEIYEKMVNANDIPTKPIFGKKERICFSQLKGAILDLIKLGEYAPIPLPKIGLSQNKSNKKTYFVTPDGSYLFDKNSEF